MTRVTVNVGKNPDFDKDVALTILDILLNSKAAVIYSGIILGLNRSPVANQHPGKLFHAETSYKSTYVGQIVHFMKEQGWVEEVQVQSKPHGGTTINIRGFIITEAGKEAKSKGDQIPCPVNALER